MRAFCLISLFLLTVHSAQLQPVWKKEYLSAYQPAQPFVAIEFNQIPTPLRSKVLSFYDSGKAVISRNDLNSFAPFIRTVATPHPVFKLSPLLLKQYEKQPHSSFTGYVQFLSINDTLLLHLQPYRFEWVYHPLLIARVTGYPDLQQLLQHPHVIHLQHEKKIRPEAYTGFADLSLHEISAFRQQLTLMQPPVISLRDGMIDTTDIDLMKILMPHSGQPVGITEHAQQMAILMSGRGLSFFSALGVLPGAAISIERMNHFFPLISPPEIHIQNNSYGSDIENVYGIEARAYDDHIFQHQHLFVFSAGNSGTETPSNGTFTGIAGFSNLTGQFKQAKNNLLTGGISPEGMVPLYSSKGPAYDGRVKPELVAIADNGTSASAAVVSGIAAGLSYSLPTPYRRNDLLKALLIAGAETIDSSAISFYSGYGMVNAGRSLRIIQQEQFFIDTLYPEGMQSYSLHVPSGLHHVRIALVWNDPPAPLFATKSLQQDLDLLLLKPGTTVYPWVLSAYPDIESLSQKAIRAEDHLNVAELITDTLDEGTYTIQIRADAIDQPISYALAYSIEQIHSFAFTHPVAGDIMIGGKNHYVRWKNLSPAQSALYYRSFNDSEEWIPVAILSGSIGVAEFPRLTQTGITQLKMVSGGNTYLSAEFLYQPEKTLQQDFLCDTILQLSLRNSVPENGLVNHFVYLDTGSLQWKSLSSVQEPVLLTDIYQTASKWVTVFPVVQGWQGHHANTLTINLSSPQCYQGSFLVDKLEQRVLLDFNTWTDHYIASVVLEKWKHNQWTALTELHPVGRGSHYWYDDSLTRGANQYRALVKLRNEQFEYTPVQTVFVTAGQEVWVYPNPAKAMEPVTVISNDPYRKRYYLYSGSGQLLKQIPVQGVETTFSIPHPARGIYYLLVVHEAEAVGVQKIIVQ